MPSDNVLLDVSHRLQMSVVWPVLLPLDDGWVNVLQVWIFDLLEWRLDLHLFRVAFCTALSPHDRMCVVKQLFEFGPMHMGWILAVAM